MKGALACRQAAVPIRLRVHSDTEVTVRVVSAPVSIRILGSPGPPGEQGTAGPAGPQGPPGNIDNGLVLDGGNF